jgi:hypothetical protein
MAEPTFLDESQLMNKTSLIGLLVTTAGICFFGNAVQAATIANWTFETSVPSTAGPLAPEVGSGSATSVHATPNSFSNPSGNGTAESWNSDSWAIGDYYQFQVSTAGLSDVAFSWDQTRSAAGPGQPGPSSPNFRLQFSTDGSTFTNVADYLVQALTWNSTTATAASQFSQNLSSFTQLNNQPTVYFRLTAIQAAQNSGGQSRVDNILVTAVPEPTAGLLVTLALVIAAVSRVSCRPR